MNLPPRIQRTQDAKNTITPLRTLLEKIRPSGPRWGEYVWAVKHYLSSQRKRRRIFFTVMLSLLALWLIWVTSDEKIIADIFSWISQFFSR